MLLCMTELDRDAANVRVPPPLVYLAGLLLGLLLHGLVRPAPLPLSVPVRIGVAMLLAIPSVLLVIGALRLFRRSGQEPEPWKPTPQIVSTGVYRFTRNPMYVGLTLFLAALGIALGNVWVLALAPVALAVVYVTAVRHEEAYLERKFGNAYLGYKSSVRRWF